MGLLAYELLSGQTPFGGSSPARDDGESTHPHAAVAGEAQSRRPGGARARHRAKPGKGPGPAFRQCRRHAARAGGRESLRRPPDPHRHRRPGLGHCGAGHRGRVRGVGALAPPAGAGCRGRFGGRRDRADSGGQRRHPHCDAGAAPLTREDSLAIARAVEGRRTTRGRPAGARARSTRSRCSSSARWPSRWAG